MNVNETAVLALRTWKADPVRMVRDLFKVEPDRWQARALAAFADPGIQRIAMQACAGPGKSAVEAWIGWNFLLCYSDGLNYPNGYAVSITGDNLRDNLWKELSLWRERCPALVKAFEMTAEAITSREHPTTWWLRARSFPKTADTSEQGRTLSGLHAKSILYLLDESGDMPPSVGQTAEQGLSNCEWGKIVQAGNPTSHDGMLYVAATEQAHLWFIIRITGDPEDPDRSPRVGLAHAKEQIALYGRTNPWVMAFILGQFPPTSVNALLGPDEVAASMKRHYTISDYGWAQKRIGIDCARFGDDSTVLFPRQGLVARNPVELKGARSEEIAGRVMLAKSRWGSELETIDDTGGWGAGAIDACRLAGVSLLPINSSGKADDPRYFNRRTEMAFRLAEWVKGGGALPKHAQLARELVSYRYRFDKGQLRILEKEEVKKLLNGKSPDFADALALTFAVIEQPGGGAESSGVFAGVGSGKLISDFDPHRSES